MGINLDKFVQANVGVVSHGDADGICSSAIIKSKNPGALVLFSKASELHKTIKQISNWAKTLDTLYIVDVAINPKSQKFVLDRLKKAKKQFSIIYIDNHLLPWEVKNSSYEIKEVNIHDYVDVYLRKENWSSSALTFTTLYGEGVDVIIENRKQALLGAYGAISDYAKKCTLLKQILDLWDESSIYYQAFLLKQASRVIESDTLKRNIADKLSVGILPSEIFEIVEAAQEASREADVAIEFIKKHAERYGDLGIIFECPVASMGHNSFVAATITNAPVGVAISRRGGYAYFVLRRQHGETIHLGELANILARDLNCDGGGEKATAGITASDDQITLVLETLDKYVKKL